MTYNPNVAEAARRAESIGKMTVIERLAKAAFLRTHDAGELEFKEGQDVFAVYLADTRTILEEMMNVTLGTKAAAVGDRPELQLVAEGIIQAAIRHILKGGE